MKTLILLAALLGATEVMARTTLLNADFGALGAEGKSLPTRSSNKEARELFNALTVAEGSGVKEVSAKEGKFTCRRMEGRNKFSCALFINAPMAEAQIQNFRNREYVSFKGEIAAELWEAMLAIPVQPRMGVIMKSAGNLSCIMSALPGQGVKHTCNLRDVRASMYTLDDIRHVRN
ncbi:MAG: hypothetical protein ACLGG0_11820 [Bacteriovoracia bacterium]